MVTDRCSTAGLLLVLSRLYDRSHAFAFLSLMFVDLFSHWMHTARSEREALKCYRSDGNREGDIFLSHVVPITSRTVIERNDSAMME